MAQQTTTPQPTTIRYPPLPDTISVTIHGSWDNWATQVDMRPPTPQTPFWTHEASLPPAKVAFKFLINGAHWRTTDAYPVEDDGFGGQNNSLVVSVRAVPPPSPVAQHPVAELPLQEGTVVESPDCAEVTALLREEVDRKDGADWPRPKEIVGQQDVARTDVSDLPVGKGIGEMEIPAQTEQKEAAASTATASTVFV